MSEWLFRYDPYPKKDKSWNSEERLLWIREVVPSEVITTTSLYEITLDASNEEDARKQALEFIEGKKPLPFPDCDEIAVLLSKFTGEPWTWSYHIRGGHWKLMSRTVFGIVVQPVFKTDTTWRFRGLFNPSHPTTGPCEMPVSIGTDSETIAVLLTEQFLPAYRRKQATAIQRVKEQEEQYNEDCKIFWSIFSPFDSVEDQIRANTCHFSFGEKQGQASVDSPGGVRFDDLTVPFDVAEKILQVLSQQAKSCQ
jgi:hypothetical protein